MLPDVEEVNCDHSLHLDCVPDNLRLLRPDIIAWHNNRSKCSIFEISVPYAYFSWGEDSLKKVYEHKKEKYRELVEFLRNRNIAVQLYPIIVSSLRAVYKDSITDLNRVFTVRSKCKTLIKRLAVNALWGSLKIWHQFRSKPPPDSCSTESDDEGIIDEFEDINNDNDTASEIVSDVEDLDDDFQQVQNTYASQPVETSSMNTLSG